MFHNGGGSIGKTGCEKVAGTGYIGGIIIGGEKTAGGVGANGIQDLKKGPGLITETGRLIIAGPETAKNGASFSFLKTGACNLVFYL